MPASKAKPRKSKKPSSRRIDEEIEESFPASDPPAFMGGKRLVGAPDRRKTPAPAGGKSRKSKMKRN